MRGASAFTRMGSARRGTSGAPARTIRDPLRNSFAMEQNTTRIALAVDGRRVDLAVPARRPVAEFLPQLVDLAGPAGTASATGWHLVRVGGDLLDPERSLAESAVLDGELIQLAPALAAPSGADVVDDVPSSGDCGSRPASADTDDPQPRVPRLRRGGCRRPVAEPGRPAAIAGGVVAAVAGRRRARRRDPLRMSGHEVDASIWAFTAIVPAAVAGWTLGRNTPIEVWWAPAVIAAAIAAVGAAVAVPARHAVLVPLAAGLVPLQRGVWCSPPGSREPGAVGGPAVILGVGDRRHRAAPVVPRARRRPAPSMGRARRQAVDDRVQRSRSMIVAGNVTGSVLIVIGAASLAAGATPGAGRCPPWPPGPRAPHPALPQPRREGAGGRRVAWSCSRFVTILPEAGWRFAAATSAVLAVALAAGGVRPLRPRPLTRRRLARARRSSRCRSAGGPDVQWARRDALPLRPRHRLAPTRGTTPHEQPIDPTAARRRARGNRRGAVHRRSCGGDDDATDTTTGGSTRDDGAAALAEAASITLDESSMSFDLAYSIEGPDIQQEGSLEGTADFAAGSGDIVATEQDRDLRAVIDGDDFWLTSGADTFTSALPDGKQWAHGSIAELGDSDALSRPSRSPSSTCSTAPRTSPPARTATRRATPSPSTSPPPRAVHRLIAGGGRSADRHGRC